MEQKAKWTAGPWEWSGDSLQSPGELGNVIWLGTDWGDAYLECSDANRALIAAAPELAEAMREILSCYPTDEDTLDFEHEAIAKARAALAKAGIQTGEA